MPPFVASLTSATLTFCAGTWREYPKNYKSLEPDPPKTITFTGENAIPYYQDHGFYRGVPPGTYTISEMKGDFAREDVWILTAPGYGGKPYGSGSLYLRKKELTHLLTKGTEE